MSHSADGRNHSFLRPLRQFLPSSVELRISWQRYETDFSGYPDCRDVFVKSPMSRSTSPWITTLWSKRSHVAGQGWNFGSYPTNSVPWLCSREKTLTCYNGLMVLARRPSSLPTPSWSRCLFSQKGEGWCFFAPKEIKQETGSLLSTILTQNLGIKRVLPLMPYTTSFTMKANFRHTLYHLQIAVSGF